MRTNSTPQHSDEIVVGLDIGTTKIACIVGQLNEHGKLEILGYGKSKSNGVARGIVANIEQTVESIQEAVAQAEKSADVKIEVVNVGIAGQHINSLQHHGQLMRPNGEDEISRADITMLINDMRKLKMLPGNEIIHVLPQEFTIDGEDGIREPVGMTGVKIEADFHIITGQVAAAKNIYRCIQRAGLSVNDLILEPIASSSAVLTDEEKEAGVALVDIGGGTTDIAIFHEGIIRHTAVIPFGGNAITDDIQSGCQLLKRHADTLKAKFGAAIASEMNEKEIIVIPGLQGRAPKEILRKNLAEIIQARMEEIIEHVHYEIKASGQSSKLIGGVVLTGGGSQLLHVRQLFQYVTGMDCRIGTPDMHLASAPNKAVTTPLFSTGIGLVKLGFTNENEGKGSNNRGADEPDRGGKSRFLDRIKKFFEEETAE
jgi:cell division protein FtsA